MNNRILAFCIAAGLAAASMASGGALSTAVAANSPAGTAEATKPQSHRYELVHRLVMKWGGHVHEAYKLSPGVWAREMGSVFAMSSLDTLQRAADATTFTAMSDVLLGKDPNVVLPGTPQTLLGDSAADLVYVPVTPCRIFDTRLAGGPIAAGTTRSFDVTAVSDYSFQGGSGTNCNGVGAAGSFAAAAVTFTVVNPTVQSYITAFPYLGTQPLAATMAFHAGGLATNTSVVKLDQGASASELSIFSPSQLHVVGDVIGYFITPEPTALECIEMQSADLALAGGTTGTIGSPSCTVGYTIVGGGCSMSSFGGRVVTTRTQSDNHFCAFANEGVGAANGVAYARCCRTPGR